MINRGVKITMANIKTFRARELSLTERHILNIEPALAASMAASSCSWIFHNTSTAYNSFVFQEVCEHSPSSITNLPCPEAVIHHSLDVKLLNSDEGIFIDNIPAEFVQEISSLIGNLNMLFVQPEDSLPSIHTSFLLPIQSSMQELQFLFGLDEETRILYLLSIGEGSEILNADINTYLFSRSVLDLNIRQFTGKYSKPQISLVDFDCQGLDLAFWDSMQDNRYASNLAQSEPFVREKLETRLRESLRMEEA